MKKNYDCIDVTKFIMSLFVVAIHTNLLKGALFPTIRLAVPVFFIFTGFLVFSKINSVPLEEKKQILWSIEKRYLKLYVIWFIILLPFTIYIRKYYIYDFFGFLIVFFRGLVFGSTFQASWYIMACILGVLCVYLLSKCGLMFRIIICVTLYIFSTFLSKYNMVINENTILNSLFLSVYNIVGNPYGNFFIAIPYIMVGKIIAEKKLSFISKKQNVICFLLCYIVLLCEFYSAKSMSWFQYNCDCWFMLAPTAIFLVLFVLKLNVKFKCSSLLKATSTIIYCSHFPISIIIGKLLLTFNIQDEYRIVVFTFTLLLTFMLSSIIIKLQKNKKFAFLKNLY